VSVLVVADRTGPESVPTQAFDRQGLTVNKESLLLRASPYFDAIAIVFCCALILLSVYTTVMMIHTQSRRPESRLDHSFRSAG
jgi:hypothetical protein